MPGARTQQPVDRLGDRPAGPVHARRWSNARRLRLRSPHRACVLRRPLRNCEAVGAGDRAAPANEARADRSRILSTGEIRAHPPRRGGKPGGDLATRPTPGPLTAGPNTLGPPGRAQVAPVVAPVVAPAAGARKEMNFGTTEQNYYPLPPAGPPTATGPRTQPLTLIREKLPPDPAQPQTARAELRTGGDFPQ
jgi:hypothetical protein